MATSTLPAGLGSSSINWFNPTAITASDDARATTSLIGGMDSDPLLGTAFGFAVPGGSTILGIQVDVERKRVSGSITGTTLQLLKASSPTGTAKTVVQTWSTSDTVASYGDGTDLWGTTWSEAEINDAGFGAQLIATAGLGASTAGVDFVQITVTYSAAVSAGGQAQEVVSSLVMWSAL